ncbi:hypothetical protein FKG94_05175 [Exilibacterium tricleocarpae]|uniref:Uncharacterized protein n=1 Tax=Exilibacterium tricleocarpae TaxID=2591008 RepID=A0A545U3K7_9GAMM|nr:hypothetical protein [Exilibacterium tricleocarpae]TQV84059.1 hypothetical protein FKG94_05175 [Exilibacterium tricleocarpae]
MIAKTDFHNMTGVSSALRSHQVSPTDSVHNQIDVTAAKGMFSGAVLLPSVLQELENRQPPKQPHTAVQTHGDTTGRFRNMQESFSSTNQSVRKETPDAGGVLLGKGREFKSCGSADIPDSVTVNTHTRKSSINL